MRKAAETDKGGLTPKQRAAAELLGAGLQRREVAGRLRVSEDTVRGWCRSPAFRRARDRAMDAFVRDKQPQAWEALARQLEDGDKKIVQQAAERLLKLADSVLEEETEREMRVVFTNMPPPGEARVDAD